MYPSSRFTIKVSKVYQTINGLAPSLPTEYDTSDATRRRRNSLSRFLINLVHASVWKHVTR